jgi:DNA-binding response OmpR family regulator
MARILVVDNEAGILSVLTTLLKAEGYDVVPLREGDKAIEQLKSEEFDLLVSDIRMTPVNGMEVLKIAREQRPGMAVIMLTAYGTVETAIEALKLGAFDYVTKPFKVDELLITVQRALEYSRALSENVDLRAQLGKRYRFENIVAESAAMRNVCEMIERVAPTDVTVLIYGESGTGKELVAKAIHAHSRRKNNKFLAVNCAALPEPLLESEMFGHVKGAFTGASANKEGLFEAAHGGTIFLDEIGAMPLSIQGKLLRVLQEKEVRRVGSNDNVSVDAHAAGSPRGGVEVPGGPLLSAERHPDRDQAAGGTDGGYPAPGVSRAETGGGREPGVAEPGPRRSRGPRALFLAGQRAGTRERHQACDDVCQGQPHHDGCPASQDPERCAGGGRHARTRHQGRELQGQITSVVPEG